MVGARAVRREIATAVSNSWRPRRSERKDPGDRIERTEPPSARCRRRHCQRHSYHPRAAHPLERAARSHERRADVNSPNKTVVHPVGPMGFPVTARCQPIKGWPHGSVNAGPFRQRRATCNSGLGYDCRLTSLKTSPGRRQRIFSGPRSPSRHRAAFGVRLRVRERLLGEVQSRWLHDISPLFSRSGRTPPELCLHSPVSNPRRHDGVPGAWIRLWRGRMAFCTAPNGGCRVPAPVALSDPAVSD